AWWFSPANNLAFAVYRYDVPDSLIIRIADNVQLFFQQKKMFDMGFDMATDDRLYCSEMICKVLNASTGNGEYVSAGFAYGRSFVGVDDLYLHPHAKLI